MATTTNQSTEQILKQLNENTDLKNLADILAKLQLFKPKDSSSKKNKDHIDDTNALPPKSTKPKLIGKKSGSLSSTSSQCELVEKKTGDKSPTNDSDGSGASGSSSRKRGSRGSRRGRRRRLRRQKQLQTERAAQLLAKMVGSQTIPPVRQTLSPPQQFFKYPRILPTRDNLHDPMTGEMRPVWSVTIPMVCHKTNTPFYAQCSTARHGYCSRCGVLRKGCKQIGSCCSQQGCGERLTAKYHRWYPGLIRLEPYGKDRKVEDYERNKDLFKKFNINWNNEDELNFVLDNYLLMKVFLVSPDFDIAPLHVERSYMIGVFAGRKFHTGALARKFLRDGLRLMSFRADFPKSMKSMPDERSQVVEEMNQIFFQGRFRCYFHGHQSNIEGWYDPTQVDPATVQNYLQAVCQRYVKEGKVSGTGAPPKSRFQYAKNPHRFAFAKQHQQQQQPKQQKTVTRSITDTSEESEGDSSSAVETPKATQYYQPQQQPAVSYVPVYVSGGQQFMTVPFAAPHGQVAFQPYGMQPYGMQPMGMQPMMQPMGMQPMRQAAPAPTNGYATNDTSSQTSEVYAQPTQAYHPGAHFVPFQPIYS